MSKSAPAVDRRRSTRKENRAEMYLGSSCSAVSNLSLDGAYVSILSGLHPEDTFSFELALDGHHEPAARGKAVVVWSDPGVGVGVRFELEESERQRLAVHLDELVGEGARVEPTPAEQAEFDPPRASRRTVAVGPAEKGGASKVWFRYFPPDKSS